MFLIVVYVSTTVSKVRVFANHHDATNYISFTESITATMVINNYLRH